MTHQERLAIILGRTNAPFLPGRHVHYAIDPSQSRRMVLKFVVFISKLAPERPWSCKAEFDVVHCDSIKQEGEEAFATGHGEGRQTNRRRPAGYCSRFPYSRDEKICTKSTHIVENYDDFGFTSISPGLATSCPATRPRPDDTALLKLVRLLAKQKKGIFSRNFAVTFGTSSWC